MQQYLVKFIDSFSEEEIISYTIEAEFPYIAERRVLKKFNTEYPHRNFRVIITKQENRVQQLTEKWAFL